MEKIVLATGNPGKVRELADLFADHGIEIVPQDSLGVVEAEETGLSFVENAILKARNAARQTGLPAIADDSGLAVDFLQGAPGIYSSRYAERAGKGAGDAANNALLLQQLGNAGEDQRGASFYCVMAYLSHADDPVPVIAQGIWRGRILHQPQGENGFGYDPLFWVAEKNCSSAQLEKSEKNRLSHRGKALRSLMENLQERLFQANRHGDSSSHSSK
ncbi:MAG: RdgB/HAM1 family non-canonical purine NTP pyrophosphatase [Gammaproteobacteria bacterium]|nr:RdgB/HAM1 family non-canonical purine NTP pyrophosphatase [Gammaproteobacteria bacterium]